MKIIAAIFLCCAFVAFNIGAQPLPLSTPLPQAVIDALAVAQVPLDSVAVIVKEAGARETLIALNGEKPMNPASVVKLVTTYAGLELLGPAYTWKTEALVSGEVRSGKLKGDLILKGYGDPKLSVERFWQLLKQLRDRGLTTIGGDLVLDRGFFQGAPHDPSRFDGEPLKPYNVGPDSLLLNFKTVRFFFSPGMDDRFVAISPDVRPVQMEIVNRVKWSEGNCGEWRDRIAVDIQVPAPTKLRISFTGNYPRRCGEKVWNLSLLDHPQYVGGVFASQWRDLGGIWNGAVKLAPTPADARLITTAESPALAEIIRDINKYSNNVMARQLFLTLSAELSKAPGSEAASTQIIRDWLARKNIAAPELTLENGSGLSRNERLSASTLAQLLDAAWKSSVMPEFMSSLSLVGADGTMRQRAKNDSLAGNAHIKTGTLTEVRAMAGYVLDTSGRRWIVVMLINHANATQAQAAQDALLASVYRSSPVVGTK
ncbi:MAG: D-alanyl-D-alanine carboxypeptidase/D-alanyl-D-alanine-endopeptidase [Betaproteobacteria bacterium]